MSMISAQIDELRKWADLYDGTTKPEMAKELQRPHLAQKLRDAADTIWELRDDLQRANAENAKLLEYARKLLTGYECGRGELCEGCSWNGWDGDCNARMKARELGIEVES